MTSILTNNSAMNALSTLRNINNNLGTTQDRISSGLKVSSAKDNAAYFQISETMKGDSSAYSSINEGLTLTKNSVATARLGAESFQELAGQFTERLAFAQGAKGGFEDIGKELNEIVKQMETTIAQSTFNGDDMVNAAGIGTTASASVTDEGVLTSEPADTSSRDVVTGISRANGAFDVTKIAVDTVDLTALLKDFKAIAGTPSDGSTDDTTFATRAAGKTYIDNNNPATPLDLSDDDVEYDAAKGQAYLEGVLKAAEGIFAKATDAATSLGLAEKSLENQQSFLTALVGNIDSGIGSMVDANMEEEAARLQALQVQQQLATQSLSIANQGPQNILSLFR